MICCIFGDADIEDYSSINVPQGALIIAADGGYRHCVRLGLVPNALVGDFDSIELDADKEKLSDKTEIIQAPAEKDDTDMLMAVKYALEGHPSSFRIYGSDGGRMGHTIANIQTLEFISDSGFENVVYGNGFNMTIQRIGIRSYSDYDKKYRYVSVFSLTDSSDIEIEGLKYSGRFTLQRSFPLGVSNEFISPERCKINVIDGKILIIFEKQSPNEKN